MIREELIRQLNSKQIKAVDVARALSIAGARVTEMKNRERKVQQDEMAPLARLLDLTDASPRLDRVMESPKIRNLGKVAQGVWLEESYQDPDDVEYVEYDRFSGDPGSEYLFAVTPEGQSMNLEFLPGTRLICRFLPFNDYTWKSGDLVIASRAAHDLRELTCKIIRFDEFGVAWLHSNSDQPQFQEPWRVGRPDGNAHDDNEITIIGKVIRAVKTYE